MSKDYLIENSGCDDITKIVLNLDADQVDVFRKITDRLNERSEVGCQPKIRITEATLGDIEEDTEIVQALEANKEPTS